MTRAEIVANSKTVVGFSYWWGGSAWKPGSTNAGQCIPLSADGCPNCQHKGPYGADCSGFVAKAWQIDKPVALDVPYHPYTTATFASGSAWWTKPAKGDAAIGDAFNYNKSGSGHVFMYEKGDPWGKVYAWECKGCAYGCVYGSRSVSADYGLLRRKLIVDQPSCKPHCEGTVLVGGDCGKGDCAAFASTCVNDNLGPRCVSAFCPAQGTTTTCLPDPGQGKIATCVNGQLKDESNCGATGGLCSTAVGKPACVSKSCAGASNVPPTSGDLCIDGQRFTCSAQGALSPSPCPAGQPCTTVAGQSGPGSGTCGPKPCENCDDSNPCTDDSCQNGVCVYVPNTMGCDDGNACTHGDHCAGGGCVATPKICDDGVACTDDGCQGGNCTHVAAAAGCDDGNPCTLDTCGATGCSHSPQDGPCEDGDGCAVGGKCKDGTCQPGKAKKCDDRNDCTSDACVDGQCVYTPVEGPCSDDDPCTVGDACAQGICLSGAIVSCDDGLDCTADTCVKGRCKHVGDARPEPRLCQGNDVWVPPACIGLQATLERCPDNAPCWQGECKPLPPAVTQAQGQGPSAWSCTTAHGQARFGGGAWLGLLALASTWARRRTSRRQSW
jgi:hypothetical protein